MGRSSPIAKWNGWIEILSERSFPRAGVNPFRPKIGEIEIVHPCDTWHNSDLGAKSPPKRSILKLIEEEVEGLGAMALVCRKEMVAGYPTVLA